MCLRFLVAGTVPAMARARRPQGGPFHRKRSGAAGTPVEDLEGGKIWSASDREECRESGRGNFPDGQVGEGRRGLYAIKRQAGMVRDADQ